MDIEPDYIYIEPDLADGSSVLVDEITSFTRSRVLAVGTVDDIIIPPIRAPRKRKYGETGI